MRPRRSPARARTWSAQCPTTSTVRRMPTASSEASMRPRMGRSPTRSSALCVVSVSGASRRATPATRTMAFTGGLGPLRVVLGFEFLLLGLHLVDELLVRRRLDDLVELGPVIADQAHALDHHVVREPAVALAQHAVLDRHLGALPGDDLAPHGGVIALDGVADVLDLLAAVQLDLGDVRALEQIAEEPHELVPLGRGAGRPVTAERALGRLGEVEDVVGDLAHGDPPVLRLAVLLELRIVEDLEHAVDLRAQLVARRAGAGVARDDEAGGGQQQDDGGDETATGCHGSPIPSRRCTWTAAPRSR